jgi:hypothetical protein
MPTGFSVFVNIGGKLSPSLAGAVSGAKTQVKGFEATLTDGRADQRAIRGR